MINHLMILVFLFFVSLHKPVSSNDKDTISIKMIVNNCSSCHLRKNHSDLIPSFFEIEKEVFIRKMIDFQKIK